MHKDSTGHVGFIFKNGKITSIVKDSSAARNGLLTEHNICEINGQNVIGLKVCFEASVVPFYRQGNSFSSSLHLHFIVGSQFLSLRHALPTKE